MFILLSCPLGAPLYGLVGAGVESAPGTICSLVTRGRTCLAFALVKHSTQSSLNFTSASDFPK